MASKPQKRSTSLKVLSSGTMTHFGKSNVAALAAPATLSRNIITTSRESARFTFTSLQKR
ncbi:hypothetical protein [Pyrococcus kukulkanii]|uniref:Uncharacterized protein n=1 Tax=Pyrococcus kukulkanii TaxID=1609559 RepID=A0ABV4T8C6_9EURY